MSDNPTQTSDTASDRPLRAVPSAGPRRPVIAHSPSSVLETILTGVNLVADLDQQECRLIPSRSVDPERGMVPTLVLTFEGGEVWYVEVERQRL